MASLLKTRVMPTLLYKDVEVVKGVGFDSWRRVGSVMQAVRVYNLREVDELVFLDVSATGADRSPDVSLIEQVAEACFMPLTVGGGIRSLEDVRRLLKAGADKVAVNTAAVELPRLVTEVAERFGSQCVVVSIDFKRHAGGAPEVFTRSGTKATGLDPVSFAREVESRGAGEILLTSIERDGTMSGYDLELTRRVSDSVSIPVIAAGGCGSYEDMARAVLEGGAAAVAAGACWQFTEMTPLEARRHLRGRGIAVRA